MIIEALKKKDGTPYTNVELVRVCYDKLNRLQNGIGATSTKEKERMEDDFFRICGGSENADNLMAFMKQIVDTAERDEDAAQKLFARALIPVDTIKNQKKVRN